MNTGTSKQVPPPQGNEQQLFGDNLTLTMEVVAHIQRIADRTGDPILHETARRAHSAASRGLNEAPGVHLTWVSPQQANELLKLAIQTQDRELADFARYCQSVAATNHIAVEPTPNKIQEEIEKGRQELQQQGRVHTGPGYGAAFATLNTKQYVQQQQAQQQQQGLQPQQELQQQQGLQQQQPQQQQQNQGEVLFEGNLALTQDVVSHCQRIADRTGNDLLKETASRAQSCLQTNQADPNVHLTWINPEQANELVNVAVRTQDRELADFARYCQSVADTSRVGVEPTQGKMQEELQKGKVELQQQGIAHTGSGYGVAFASQPTTTGGAPQQ